MAAADYRLCDVCDGKVFYDANLNYERGRDNEWAKRKAPFRWAGEEQGKPENDDQLLRLDYLGDWAVICNDCAKTHKTIVVPIDAQIEAQAAEIERLTKSEQIEAQIEARDALLDFISENGTASEGVQHYLDRYVRAALAARETK